MKLMYALTSLSFLMCGSAFAVGESEADLLKTLPASKHSLIQAIQQVSKMGETPTAAKFEYEDGALHLAVYSSAKGTKVDAEHTVLKEFKGDPQQAAWKPAVEVFKDVEHVSRSAEYHTLMELSPSALADIASKAEALGTVVWVIPMVAAGKPTFDVGVFSNGKLQHVRYGLLDGKKE
jgi:hypothetical protein